MWTSREMLTRHPSCAALFCSCNLSFAPLAQKRNFWMCVCGCVRTCVSRFGPVAVERSTVYVQVLGAVMPHGCISPKSGHSSQQKDTPH